ncbi:Peptidyl-prolyl cis-trans isomerase FKBP16-1, chloroplastic [Sesamum alatum]|uniref:Peptidyl-prolyl cis-trans isomerase FKBP16-1, chloroplastic n=1 Tax=Sesamum alatum TaxID=300844 RepID=A0AAE1Z1J2_9LAMI|nr:Peptidyl-prolyl cis-trans isomerase FKBP16-1, chloroplastic [Sesamum alatum]
MSPFGAGYKSDPIVYTYGFVTWLVSFSSIIILISRYLELWKLLHFKSVCSLRRFSLLLQDYRIRKTEELKVSAQRNLKDGYPSIVAKKVPRRTIFQLVGVNVIYENVCAALAAPVQEMKEPDVLRTVKLASGVRIQGRYLRNLQDQTVPISVFPYNYTNA